MVDLTQQQGSECVRIVGGDEEYAADVILESGKKKLRVDATVTIEELLGQDTYADSWFRIVNAGALGDTITITIGPTSNDPSTPDRDRPQYQKVVTVTASEVGDEVALRDKIIAELKADINFTPYFKALYVKDNAIVVIRSALRGEFWESDTFSVVSAGAMSITLGFADFKSRGKVNSLSYDPDDPRVGVLGISGSVSVTPGAISNFFFDYLKHLGSQNMCVNGSITPVPFTIESAACDCNIFIQKISLHAQGNGIKFGQFLSKNLVLANGITFTIVSEGQTIAFPEIYATEDIKHEFPLGEVKNFLLNIQAGRDDLVSTVVFDPPILLVAKSSDKIEMVVRDDLTVIMHLEVFATGFRKEV